MNQQTLLSIYEKIEGLVGRLPGPLQNAVLNELRPIKQIFLTQRPARIAFLGQSEANASALLSALLGSELRLIDPPQGSGWISYEQKGKGGFCGLDARSANEASRSWANLTNILAEDAPDICLFLVDGTTHEDLGSACDQASRVLEFVQQRFDRKIPLIAVIDFPDLTPAEIVENGRAELQERLTRQSSLGAHFVRAIAVSSFVRFRQDGTLDPDRDQRKNIRDLANLLARELPEDAQVDAARLFGTRELQRELASRLTRSVSAISAAIGAQPIPLADFPILTTLQFAMVAGIMHISGRELNLRAAAEFLGALGMNIGAGMVLREGARAAVKLLPGWGNAISGGVAAAGTYGIGKAASSYFIEGLALSEVRRFLQVRIRLRKRRGPGDLADLSGPESKRSGEEKPCE
ncbi:MAG: hypothetical protein JO271_13320 [Verrucomicrobia bacterium]|nr:hypothetical protein [Verrucomicrobiota bacterium]